MRQFKAGEKIFPATTMTTTKSTDFVMTADFGAKRIGKSRLKVLDGIVGARLFWNPTLDIYEASRDLQKTQINPAFADYLHPVLEEFFKPNHAIHGSYFIGWASTDEPYWKEDYRIWMKALVEFEKRVGVIWSGEDAGFIYQMCGFGLIRELELHQEMGFHPHKVVQHITGKDAKIMGLENPIGPVQ